MEVCRHLDFPVPEQATQVPKISSSSRLFCERQVLMVQQTAEQLVEVSLHGLVQLNVDIPVPHGRGHQGGLFKFYALDRIQQRFMVQITLTFRFRVVDLQGFLPDRLPLLHLRGRLVLRMRCLLFFFLTFPQNKKSARVAGSRVESARARQIPRRLHMRRPTSLRTATSIMKVMRRYGQGWTRASGSYCPLILLWSSLGHDSGSPSDSVSSRWVPFLCHGGWGPAVH